MTPADLRAKATAALPVNGGGGSIVLKVERKRAPRGEHVRPFPGGPLARVIGDVGAWRILVDMPAAPLLAYLDKHGL